MDVATIDQQYNELQSQSQQTVQELQQLAMKLQSAGQAGDPNARDWLLDLKSIALAIRSEQQQVQNLLQALHGFVANQAQAMQQSSMQQQYAPPPPQSAWSQPQQYGQPPQQQGGMLGGFLNSGFGRAIEMGAGFGIGDEIINKIF